MFGHHIWLRFRKGRIIILAIRATTVFLITAAGSNAAVFSFWDSVREFVGLPDSMASSQGPADGSISPSSPEVRITTPGVPVRQNFDTLAAGGTTNVWTDDSTLAGWYSQFAPTPTSVSLPFWPMQSHDAQRTGRGAVPGPINNAIKWYYDFAGERLQDNASSVVGPDGTVYQPTETSVFAINSNGTLKWKASNFWMRSAPALSPDSTALYVVRGLNTVVALNTLNGSVLWQYSPGSSGISYSSFAVATDGTIYFGTRLPASVYALNPNGTLRWRYEQPNGQNIGTEAPPVVDTNGNVYVEINNVGLVSLDANGSFRWGSSLYGGYGWLTPAIGPDGAIYAAGEPSYQQEGARAVNPDGTLKWARNDIGSPGFFAGVAISGDGSTIYRAGAGKVYALNTATGATRWSGTIAAADQLFGGSLIASSNGLLYVRSHESSGANSSIYAVSSTNGALIWQLQLNSANLFWGPQSPALGPDGTLYTTASGNFGIQGGTTPGRLYAFGPAPQGPDPMLTKTHNGLFYVGTNGVYSMTVSNVGTADTSGTLTVTDTLATGLSFVSGTGANWNCSPSGQTVTCTNPGPLAVGVNSIISLTVAVSAGAVPNITNTANLTNASDVNTSNNAAADFTISTSGPPPTPTPTPTPTPSVRTAFDFDGDNKTDASIFRPGPGEWWWSRSSNGGNGAVQFGVSTDTVAAADYTGDRKTDIAFFRPSTGFWYVLRSEDFSFYAFPFGGSGDIPAPADYDGDGKADPTVFRPTAATWYISKSSGGTTITQFGAAGDLPVAADYDGDGKADVGIFRPSAGQWWIQRSTAGLLAVQFGAVGDRTVQGDYTGDGKADIAFWTPSSGNWFVLRSEDYSYFAFPFGSSTDVPAPGDYDGDGKADAAIFRPSTATWFANNSGGSTLIQQFGATGDIPVPNAFVR